jgi:hypothetical protein
VNLLKRNGRIIVNKAIFHFLKEKKEEEVLDFSIS